MWLQYDPLKWFSCMHAKQQERCRNTILRCQIVLIVVTIQIDESRRLASNADPDRFDVLDILYFKIKIIRILIFHLQERFK